MSDEILSKTLIGRGINFKNTIYPQKDNKTCRPDKNCIEKDQLKHKPTNVGRIAFERQAGGKTFDPNGIRTIDNPLHNHMHCRLCYLALIFAMLQPTVY